MGINDAFSSNRDKDYTRLTDSGKEAKFIITRGHLLNQLVDRAKWHVAPKFFHVVDFPTHLDIEASFACQMKCPMCLRKRLPKDLAYGIMDLGLYKKIVDEAVRRGVFSIKLSWRGEPLLNPGIVDMVRYAKEKGIKDVAFLTNGERLNPELAERLVEAGLDWISFSIDGMGETYERIRWPSTWEGIVSKVRHLRDCRERHGLKKPLIRVQTIWGAVKGNYADYFDFWEQIADKVCVIADQERWERGVKHVDVKYVCFEPWRRLVVGWNGIVAQCISDYENYGALGDVRTESLYGIWHGEKLNRLRRSIRTGRLFENKACSMCHEPCLMEERILAVKGRKIKIGLYKGQSIDVSKMDARPANTNAGSAKAGAKHAGAKKR